MYYFGYGSNMKHYQMKDRCGNAIFVKRVFLKNYKFVYDGYSNSRAGSVGNVVNSNEHVVWGGLFKIDKDCLIKLDRYEGYPDCYDRKELKVIDDDGNEYMSYVYLREGRELGRPKHNYMQVILEGAKDCNLPNEYIKRYLQI